MAGKARGLSVPSASTCDGGLLLPLVVAIGATAPQLGGVALASLFSMVLPFGEGSGRASSKILSIDSLGCLCALVIPEAGQPRSGI